MSSFTRDDYLETYNFARSVYFKARGKPTIRDELVPWACSIMDMCEGVIGQQSDRPTGSISATKTEE